MTRYGFCVPMFANPGAAFFRTPAWTTLDPAAAIDAAVEAERLGFDSIWVADHLMHGFDDAILEGWTTLSVIAGRTSRVQLGTIHLAQPFRHPAIVAKMAASLDALSGGRLIFFYDCGWQEAEVRAYGLDWPAEDERIARMEDGLELIKQLWRATAETPVSYSGTYFSTHAAVCRPGPLQQPRPPIWLGEARTERWLDAIVGHADGWNSVPASPSRLKQKLQALQRACARAGRDMSELELSLEIQVLIAPTEQAVADRAREIAALSPSKRGTPRQDVLQALAEGRSLGEVVDDWLVGTPTQIAEQLHRYTELGIAHFMLWFVDFPSLEGMRLFAQGVTQSVTPTVTPERQIVTRT